MIEVPSFRAIPRQAGEPVLQQARRVNLEPALTPSDKVKHSALPGPPIYPFAEPVTVQNAPHGKVRIKNKSIFIQIDGLTYAGFLAAMKMGLIPNATLDYLVKKDYRIKPFYCGQESATAASTSALLYGIQSATPSFHFLDQASGKRTSDLNASLNQPGRQAGLLEEGTVYTMLFDGDSKQSNFVMHRPCREQDSSSSQPSFMFKLLKVIHTLRPDTLIATLAEAAWSFLVNFKTEFKKNPKTFQDFQGAVSNAVKQACLNNIAGNLSTQGICFDISHGVPVSWINLVGYDNGSHFFGPFSNASFRTLGKIFKNVDTIVREIQKHPEENYHLYLLSDHGQIPTETFRKLYGVTLSTFLKQEFGQAIRQVTAVGPHAHLFFKNGAKKIGLHGIKTRWPGALERLIQHPAIGAIALNNGDETTIITKRGDVRVKHGQVVSGEAEHLRSFGPEKIVAWQIDHEASRSKSGDLILYATVLPTLEGSGFSVDFEDEFWRGNHGSVGGHQGIAFIAHSAADPIETQKIMGSWDLHYQLYGNLTGDPVS